MVSPIQQRQTGHAGHRRQNAVIAPCVAVCVLTEYQERGAQRAKGPEGADDRGG